MVTALYPGAFDPITMGHVDIATRASALFDQVVIGVYARPDKSLLFSVDERAEMARVALKHLTNVTVRSYDTLTVDFARQLGAEVTIRGLRTGSDFEYEFTMAYMNKKLVAARPLAHLKIGVKNVMHLMGVVSPKWS